MLPAITTVLGLCSSLIIKITSTCRTMLVYASTGAAGRVSTLPQRAEGMLIRKGVSAMFPFNLRFAGGILPQAGDGATADENPGAAQTTMVFPCRPKPA